MSAEKSKQSVALAVAERVAKDFASLLQVETVAMAGSQTAEFADLDSDVDLYVYVTADITLQERARIAGEKRFLDHAKVSCKKLPSGMEKQVRELVGNPDGDLVGRINAMVDGLEELLAREGLMPEES